MLTAAAAWVVIQDVLTGLPESELRGLVTMEALEALRAWPVVRKVRSKEERPYLASDWCGGHAITHHTQPTRAFPSRSSARPLPCLPVCCSWPPPTRPSSSRLPSR